MCGDIPTGVALTSRSHPSSWRPRANVRHRTRWPRSAPGLAFSRGFRRAIADSVGAQTTARRGAAGSEHHHTGPLQRESTRLQRSDKPAASKLRPSHSPFRLCGACRPRRFGASVRRTGPASQSAISLARSRCTPPRPAPRPPSEIHRGHRTRSAHRRRPGRAHETPDCASPGGRRMSERHADDAVE